MTVALLLLVTCVFLLGSLFLVFRMRRRRFYELADKLPGPPEIPLIGHLHRFVGNREDMMTSIKEFSYLAAHEGGIVKLWIGYLLFCMLTDPVDIEFVLKSCLEKDDIFGDVFRDAYGNCMAFARASIWHRRRKVATPAFAAKNLVQFIKVFTEQSDTLLQELRHIGDGEFDIYPHMSKCSIKSILEVALGVDIKARKDRVDTALEIVTRLMKILCARTFNPLMTNKYLFRLTPSYQTQRTCLSTAYAFIDDFILEGKQRIKQEALEKYQEPTFKPFLSLLMDPPSKGTGYDDLELREEITLLALAATDTSSVGACFTLMLLGRHQDVQDKLYSELVDVFGKSDRPLVKEDLSKLCYLEQVIKESLRLYPPAPVISRETDKEITLPSGKVLPAGCAIPISIWGVHHNSAYWGADVEQFRPERFSPERYNPQHACVYMPFSAGPRGCIGLQYAMMSLKTSLSTVLRRYRVRAPAVSSTNIRVKFEIMMKPVEGFNISLEQRC